MSHYPEAILIYGVPLKLNEIVNHVTRYNEVTGKPYQKENYTYARALVVGEREILYDFSNVDEDNIELFNEDGAGDGVFGVEIASVDPQDFELIGISELKIPASAQKFKDAVDEIFPADAGDIKEHARLYLMGLSR